MPQTPCHAQIAIQLDEFQVPPSQHSIRLDEPKFRVKSRIQTVHTVYIPLYRILYAVSKSASKMTRKVFEADLSEKLL